MKGAEKSQIYNELLDLIIGHLSAHKMAQWENEKIVEKLSEFLIKRIWKRFDIKFKTDEY
jgi:hypothetical protein